VVNESKAKAAAGGKKKGRSGPGLLDSNGIAWKTRVAEADADYVPAPPASAAFAMGSLGL
jgi:hypothetical protein